VIKNIIALILMFVPSIYWGFIFRFQNPHLTETQLFLDKWFLLLPILVGLGLYLWRKD